MHRLMIWHICKLSKLSRTSRVLREWKVTLRVLSKMTDKFGEYVLGFVSLTAYLFEKKIQIELE